MVMETSATEQPKSQLANYHPYVPKMPPKKALTFGQKLAGISLTQTNSNKVSDVKQIRLLYASIFDILHEDMQSSDQERERLAKIALDEARNTMNSTIRALTYGS